MCFISFSQNSGLYGKKICIDFNATGNMPLINMFNGPMYKNVNGALESKMDLFDYGFRTSVSYAVANNFAVGLEFDMDFMNIHPPEYMLIEDPFYPGYYDHIHIRHENLKTKTFVIMPRLSFASAGSLLPIGLSHQIGIGYTSTKIVDKDYLYIPSSNYPDDIDEKLYDYTQKGHKGLAFMYTLNVRTPINKFMMITYGIRYDANLNLSNSDYDPDDWYSTPDQTDEYYFTTTAISYSIWRRRLFSVVSLNLGMAFAL